MATELASTKLPNQEAAEFRSDVNRLLKQQQQQQHHKQCNLTPAQCRALTQLKEDNNRVILTADKGVAMVVMDQQDYSNKAQALLQDTNTYKVLPKDPTPQLKNKLISLLKNIHQAGGLSTQKYKQLYPTSAVPPKFYGLPKIHKTGTPLRPIVSSRGSITYGVAKELSYIIKPLVGQSPHHLKNTQHFIQQYMAKSWKQEKSSPPMMSRPSSHQYQSNQPSKLLNKDSNRTPHSHKGHPCQSPKITSLLEFCLTLTYFLSPKPTSSSRVSIINKHKVQLWDPPSAPS